MADTWIRILRCDVCKTLEEVPDYEGDPKYDYVMEAAITHRHLFPSGERHLGQAFRVEEKYWRSPTARKTIFERLKEQAGGGNTGFDPEFYETRDTFKQDAMTCWKQHFRNADCNEYEDDRKRLTPGTAAERKAAGLPRYRSEKDVYLCHFCPVHTKVTEARRWQAGLYK